MSIVPYLRPDLDQYEDRPLLYITGSLPNAKPGLAYEARLQIHNQIGACSLVSVTGDELPPGSLVYIDDDEIVIAWPAYVESAAPIVNPGFEDGMNGWQGGAGWSTTTYNPIAGARSAVFHNAPGSSILSSQSRYPVNPGVPITATAAIRQGASSAGNAGAGVRIEFRNADGSLRRFKDGNMVMSASNNAVKPSTVTDSPQPGDELVNIACHGLRKRQNREVWADTFAWDHAVAAAGINADATICITIQIRDGAGRTALWSGCVNVQATAPASFLVVGDFGVNDVARVIAGGWASPSISASGLPGIPAAVAASNTGRAAMSDASNSALSPDAGVSWGTGAPPTGPISKILATQTGRILMSSPSLDAVYRTDDGVSTAYSVKRAKYLATSGVPGARIFNYYSPGDVFYSDDNGVTWLTATAPPFSLTNDPGMAGDPIGNAIGIFHISGTTVKFATTSNMTSFVEETPPVAPASTVPAALVRTPTGWVGFSMSGRVWARPDSTGTWVLRAYVAPQQIFGACAVGEQIYAVGNSGMVIQSDDLGLTWGAVAHGLGTANLTGICVIP